jgi:hypothetical protein
MQKSRHPVWNACLEMDCSQSNDVNYFSSLSAASFLAMMGTFASLKCQMLASVMCK